MYADGQKPITIAHSEHFVCRWTKNRLCCWGIQRPQTTVNFNLLWV